MKEIQLPEPKQPLVPGSTEGHQKQWTDACKKGYGAFTSSGFDIAGPLTETVLMGNLAIHSFNWKEGEHFDGRKKLMWDGQQMRITNFEPANRFVKRTYRGDYSLKL
jgi:hypothetical protein